MLGKLLKHEWKSTCKLMTAINLTVLALTLTGCCILSTTVFDNQKSFPLAVFLFLFYVLSLTAFGIITGIYLYARFYRNLFTAEGYLMHTLPATPLQLFHAKLIVGYFWSMITTALTTLAILALGFTAGFHFADTHDAESIQEIMDELSIAFSNGTGDEAFSLQTLFGYTPLQIIVLVLLLLLANSFTSLLMGYLSILLGQLMEKYRLASAIGFYIVLYIGNQIISSIFLILPMFRTDMTDIENLLSHYYHYLLPGTILSQLVVGLLFYVISLLLMRRKVNLE